MADNIPMQEPLSDNPSPSKGLREFVEPPTIMFMYNGKSYTFPFKEGATAGLQLFFDKSKPTLYGGYTEQELIALCAEQDKVDAEN